MDLEISQWSMEKAITAEHSKKIIDYTHKNFELFE